MRNLWALSIVSCLSATCHAAWTGPLTVVKAFTEAKTDLLVIYTSDGTEYTPGCSANNWIFSANTDARANRGYATALAAVAAGKKVKLWYSDTCSSWSYHEATSIMLLD